MNTVLRLLLALPLGFASTACESGSTSSSSPAADSPAHQAPAAPARAAQSSAEAAAGPAQPTSGSPSKATAGRGASVARYGAALEPSSPVPLAHLLSNPRAYADQTVTTEGTVQRACSRKGCWMELGSGDDACRVTFKDYGFFVPTDSAGAFAKIQGRLDTREVEPAAVNHLEAEGARFRNKKPDGSATEVRLIASAVELTR